MGKIKNQGVATRTVECDVIEYEIVISSTDSKLSKAIDEVMKSTEKLLEALNKLGIQPEELHLEKDSTDEIERSIKSNYRCIRKITFKTSTVPSINDKIFKAVKENNIHTEINTSYSYSKENELRQQLLQEALLNAKQAAQLLANTTN